MVMINGNGKAMTNDRALATNAQDTVNEVGGQFMKLPAWLEALRSAMGEESVQPDDLKEIMSAQVKKAKEGNLSAAKFVLDRVDKMADQQLPKSVSITQNNYYDQPAEVKPDTPLTPQDDEKKQLLKLRARARAGVPLTGGPDDQRVHAVSDEEEKEIRRRQQAEENAA